MTVLKILSFVRIVNEGNKTRNINERVSPILK